MNSLISARGRMVILHVILLYFFAIELQQWDICVGFMRYKKLNVIY
jgi:hypothetical protein